MVDPSGRQSGCASLTSRTGALDSKFIVYVLLCSDNTHYIGQTNNLNRRMHEHLNGKVQYTKSRRPLKLVYTEIFSTRDGSVKKEKFLKSRKGRRYLNKVL